MFELKAQEKIEEPKSENEMVLSEKAVVGGTWKTVRSQICGPGSNHAPHSLPKPWGLGKRLYFLGLKFLSFKVKQ